MCHLPQFLSQIPAWPPDLYIFSLPPPLIKPTAFQKCLLFNTLRPISSPNNNNTTKAKPSFHCQVAELHAMSRVLTRLLTSWVTLGDLTSPSCFLTYAVGIITATSFTGLNGRTLVKPLAWCPEHSTYSINTICYYLYHHHV